MPLSIFSEKGENCGHVLVKMQTCDKLVQWFVAKQDSYLKETKYIPVLMHVITWLLHDLWAKTMSGFFMDMQIIIEFSCYREDFNSTGFVEKRLFFWTSIHLPTIEDICLLHVKRGFFSNCPHYYKDINKGNCKGVSNSFGFSSLTEMRSLYYSPFFFRKRIHFQCHLAVICCNVSAFVIHKGLFTYSLSVVSIEEHLTPITLLLPKNMYISETWMPFNGGLKFQCQNFWDQ